MSYDDIIPLLGDFGPYQKKIYFLLCLPAILCAFHKLGNVFLLAEPKYRCKLPHELPNASYHLTQAELETFYPYDKSLRKPGYSPCQLHLNGSDSVQSCNEFIFDHDVYGYTSVIEWNLTCNKTYLVAVTNSLFMFGVMVGSIGFGDLSDRWGRKKTFFLSLVIQVVFGIIASFAPELWSFSIARAIVGATTSGVFLVAYVIGLEMVGPKSRIIAGTVCQMFFSLGYMLTALFAFYIRDWRNLQFALTLPGLVFLPYWWLIPESARWLASNNRIEEAKKGVRVAAKYNNVKIPEETLDRLLSPSADATNENNSVTILDIFRYPRLRKRSLIIFFDWFANNIAYYGLSWNTNNLSGNPYLNFVISGAVEFPAYLFLIFTVNRWGRRNVMCSCMLAAGIALLLTVIVPNDMPWLIVTFAMIGKLAITASYGTVYIFSTEQFPTVIRNAGLGAGSTCARVGSVIAPYANMAAYVWQPLPLVIFGIFSLIGGVMSLCLPETLNRKLPETLEEGEDFGRETKMPVNNSEELEKINTESNENNANAVETTLLTEKSSSAS